MIRCEGPCQVVETQRDTKVCTQCGCEEKCLQNCTTMNCGFTMRHSPFLSGYSRKKRFRGMVDALFWPTPCNADSKMLKYLSTHPCNRRDAIIETMAASSLKDKRFSSIHMFCRLYDTTYMEPSHGDLFEMLKNMVFAFEEIESKFKLRFTGIPFINYTFLIRHLLTKLKYTSYLPFVKKLKCQKRRMRYNNMLKELFMS